jgi:hypothetical protein
MVVPPHLRLIPGDLTDKALQPTDSAPLDVAGHGLERFALKGTELAHQIVKEMDAWLTTGKTVVEERLELPQFVYEAFNIPGDDLKRGNGKACTVSPTGW